MTCTRTIDGVTYIDAEKLWAGIAEAPNKHKSQQFMKDAGVAFFDKECNFVKKPVVGITGFGGFPVTFSKKAGEITVNGRAAAPLEHLAELKKTRGFAGQVTNMNTGSHAPEAMDDLTSQLGHLSKLRTTVLDVLVTGYPAAIEANFARWYGGGGLTHIGLQTMCRTVSQSAPPVYVGEPEFLEAAQKVRAATMDALAAVGKTGRKGESLKDAQEDLNGLFPKNAATTIFFSGTLKAFESKMWELNPESGQETAFRHVLALLNDSLVGLFPEFFRPNVAYDYFPPEHF